MQVDKKELLVLLAALLQRLPRSWCLGLQQTARVEEAAKALPEQELDFQVSAPVAVRSLTRITPLVCVQAFASLFCSPPFCELLPGETANARSIVCGYSDMRGG